MNIKEMTTEKLHELYCQCAARRAVEDSNMRLINIEITTRSEAQTPKKGKSKK